MAVPVAARSTCCTNPGACREACYWRAIGRLASDSDRRSWPVITRTGGGCIPPSRAQPAPAQIEACRAFSPHARAKKLARAAECLIYSLTPSGVLGGKPPKKSGFRRHLAGSKMPKETFFTAISRRRVVSRRMGSGEIFAPARNFRPTSGPAASIDTGQLQTNRFRPIDARGAAMDEES